MLAECVSSRNEETQLIRLKLYLAAHRYLYVKTVRSVSHAGQEGNTHTVTGQSNFLFIWQSSVTQSLHLEAVLCNPCTPCEKHAGNYSDTSCNSQRGEPVPGAPEGENLKKSYPTTSCIPSEGGPHRCPTCICYGK